MKKLFLFALLVMTSTTNANEISDLELSIAYLSVCSTECHPMNGMVARNKLRDYEGEKHNLNISTAKVKFLEMTERPTVWNEFVLSNHKRLTEAFDRETKKRKVVDKKILKEEILSLSEEAYLVFVTKLCLEDRAICPTEWFLQANFVKQGTSEKVAHTPATWRYLSYTVNSEEEQIIEKYLNDPYYEIEKWADVRLSLILREHEFFNFNEGKFKDKLKAYQKDHPFYIEK